MNQVSAAALKPRSAAVRLPRSGEIVRVILILLGIAALAALAWRLADVLAMLFAAILIAVAVRSLGELISRLSGIRLTWSIILVCAGFAGLSAAFVYFLGGQISAQISGLSSSLPAALDRVGAFVGVDDLGENVRSQLQTFIDEPRWLKQLLGATAGLLGIAANVVLVLIAGLYLAIRPDIYEGGILILIPHRYRDRLATALTASAHALKLWLLGQLVSMALVGVLTGVGLVVIGVPSPLPLALAAALLEFIPFVGPWLSAVPAVLAALSMEGSAIYWVIGLYVVVQQLEGNVITPLVQRRAVDLPPAVTMFALVAMAVVMGPLGLVLATPIAVIVMVFVTQLYVRDTLHETVRLPGEHHPRSAAGKGETSLRHAIPAVIK